MSDDVTRTIAVGRDGRPIEILDGWNSRSAARAIARFFSVPQLALRLAMVAGAFQIIYPKLCSELRLDLFRFFDLALFLPAAWLGLGSLWRVRSFARSTPVLACVLLAWLGVFYANTESNRGYLIAAYLTLGLPIGALIAEQRCWWMSARTYVVSNLAMLAAVCWMESDPQHGFFATFLRLGFLRSVDGTRWSSPDKLGGQLATAAVLALVLYLRRGTGRRKAWMEGDGSIHLVSFAILSLGVVLTASRGAFVAWAAGVGLLMVQALRVHDRNRARDLALGVLVGMATLVFVAVDSEYGPWQRLKARFGAHEELWTLCGRTEIWTGAYEAWTADWRTILIGTGTGRADEAMGNYDRLAVEDDYGNLRRNAHSLYVEWALSFGAVGVLLGGYLLWAVLRQAYRLDRADGVLARQAIVACVGLFAMTAIVHRWPGWLPSAALIVAMLTDGRRKDLPCESSTSTNTSPRRR